MMSEARYCEFQAQRAVDRRRKLEETDGVQRKVGAVLVSAMLAEAKFVEDALKHLKLNFYERMRYVEDNSEYIYATDGEEAIQVVWMSNRQVCVHRLTSPEMRREFKATGLEAEQETAKWERHYLGHWVDHTHPKNRERLRAILRNRLEGRVRRREVTRLQSVLDFGSKATEQTVSHIYPQG